MQPLNNATGPIIVVHPDLRGRGGSEAVFCWAVQALKDLFEVHVVTIAGADFIELNAAYGTNISNREVHIHETGISRLFDLGDALRGAYFHRCLRRIVDKINASIVFSAYNLLDVGVPTIQRIGDFSWDDQTRRELHGNKSTHGWHRDLGLGRRLYLAFCKHLSGFSLDRALCSPNVLVSNSNWTAKLLLERHNAASRVIYPPVLSAPITDANQVRKNRFVCLGRISPEKELEKVIEVISGVRDLGHDVSLHFLGALNNEYAITLKKQAATRGDWIVFEGAKYGDDKLGFIRESAFAIHGCRSEAFGIAIAELVQAGCITFVPNVGGQSEIVNDDRLVYADVDDAVGKISAVLNDAASQKCLREDGIKGTGRFSEQNFMQAVRSLVAEAIV